MADQETALSLPELLTAVMAVDRWLDDAVADTYKDQPIAQHWGRIAKVIEELGEAIAELILWTGQNPRKGQDPEARERLLAELGDTAMTGIFAIQHITKDPERTWEIISAAFTKAHKRAIEAGY